MMLKFERFAWWVPVLLVAAGSAAAVMLAGAHLSGCCGGPPTGTCNFVETFDGGPDASINPDAAVLCGAQICIPGETTCCFQESSPSEPFKCIPVGTVCAGQQATCDDDGDCPGGGALHCCGRITENQIKCEFPCPGGQSDGTLRLCRMDRDCPPEHPLCRMTTFRGRQLLACM
jgi:hypothetical protein